MAFRRLCVYGPTPAVSSRRGIELARVDTRARVRAIQGKIYMASPRFSRRFVVLGTDPRQFRARNIPPSIPGKRGRATKESIAWINDRSLRGLKLATKLRNVVIHSRFLDKDKIRFYDSTKQPFQRKPIGRFSNRHVESFVRLLAG